MIVFGCFFQTVLKEMEYPFLEVKQVYRVKEDKFYLVSNQNETFLLEVDNIFINEEKIKEEVTLCKNITIIILLIPL